MDNRTDVTEDQQATPEHAAFQAKTSPATGQQAGPNAPRGSGLTAGPHNDPPPSHGIENTYRPPVAEQAPRWARLQAVARNPTQLAFTVLGVSLVLLAIRGLRSR